MLRTFAFMTLLPSLASAAPLVADLPTETVARLGRRTLVVE